VFRAMVQKESRKQPWVFNVDGEGFWFQTKDQAVNALWVRGLSLDIALTKALGGGFSDSSMNEQVTR